MDQPTSVVVEALSHYNEKDAAEIGRLLASLSDNFDDSPVAEELLSAIIASPFHDQLVARSESGTIMGIATLSIIIGAGSVRTSWLEDFIVDPNIRGTGIGSALWNFALDWSRSKNAKKLNFTSRPSRESAQKFYLKRGATIRETNVFTKIIT